MTKIDHYAIYWLLLLTGCGSQPASDRAVETNSKYFREWRHYLGDPARTHYSSLDQINKENVNSLEVAWHYKSGGLVEGRTSQIQTNPLIIDGKLIGVSAGMSFFALDAATGQKLWEFKPSVADDSGLGLSRGFNYWPGEEGSPGRLFVGSGPRLYAINAEKGDLISDFGEAGSIDLREGLGRDPTRLTVVLTTPGVVFRDLLILGSRTSESPGAAPGHIRAYDVRTGELAWIFHTIPQPGQYGYESWPEDAFDMIGGANSWAGMALDEERGIVYVPTGSAAFDWYGGNRIGDNLFANTLLALNASDGERIWHYQFVRHDLWDRDLPAPPNLVEIKRQGKTIPAVAQITKSGHVFVFNRVTGEPLFPLQEKVYPETKLEGDQVSRIQPLPKKPAPFARQALHESDLLAPDQPAFVDDFLDKGQNERPITVLEKLREVTSKGQFIPIDTKGVILYPGADGGAEWGGAAIDPRSGVLYVNANEMAWIVRMSKVGEKDGRKLSLGESLSQIHCARCHGGNLQGLGAIPSLQEVGDRLSSTEIGTTITNGKGAMPGLPNLTSSEVSALVDFLRGVETQTEESHATDHRAEQNFDTPYAIVGFGRFKDERGFPVMKPPWGTLSAIDLNTGEYLWRVPLGHDQRLDDPRYPVTGTENYGGPVITAGNILFIAATRDEKFRAFDLNTGDLLWEAHLPAGGYATPATYQLDGKQYVVVACGGGKMGTPSGDGYVAFALP